MDSLSLLIVLPYLVGWFFAGLLFGFLCQHVAVEKGRSSAGWFLLGFFFTLPALIAIAGLPVIENIQWMARNQKDERAYRRCPKCYEYILKGATRCRYCTSNVEPIPTQESQ